MQISAPFEAYRGDEPYLFVSYAHKDSALVYPILERLRERGWRMWYDEGIDPGNEWTAFIETSLTGCRQVLCFISPNSVESLNCRQEVNLAVDDQKPVLAVHVCETELKYGLRLRLSAFQAVMKYRIDSDDEFYRALDRGLDPMCREPGAADSPSTMALGREPTEPVNNAKKPRFPVPALVAGAFAICLLLAVAGFAVLRSRAPHSAQPEQPVAQEGVATPTEATTDSPATTSLVTSPSPAIATRSETAPSKQPSSDATAQAAKASTVGKGSASKLPTGFVAIAGGQFVMGSPAKEVTSDNNEILHTVSVSPFYIAAKEVTQAEWLAVMGSNPSEFKGDDLPVERVSWYEAISFCNRLSLKQGRSPCYAVNGKTDPAKWGGIPEDRDPVFDLVTCNYGANGYRLPTEAEWEYACRADARSAFFVGANVTTDQANYDGTKPYNGASAGERRGTTVSVGSFPPNSYGIYDMSGNVWEWCNDWFGPYTEGADPTGPSDGASRIVRGGSWDTGAQFLRSAYRGGAAPQTRGNDLGLRLVFRK